MLARRLGIPITLAVLMIEVGRRLGVPLVGVGMPGHFLVRERASPDRFADPFHGGVVLSGRRLRDRVPSSQRWQTPSSTGSFLQPVSEPRRS